MSLRRWLLPLSLAAGFITTSLDAHPLHTSVAEITYDAAHRQLQISLRVFVDDLTKASDAYARSRPTTKELRVDAYARSAFTITDRSGRQVMLQSCGGKLVSDLMWLCYRAAAPAGLSGFKVAHRILFDLYSDQINIVQANNNGKKQSLLFTHGDGLKRLD
ncbi:MAG TPA: DUF6702 family protein [Gemmatimonadaceae bacterium]|nr:DUF6702 family protein [Gemmatimonadaceae bacterium]